jgi:hypothetical protein
MFSTVDKAWTALLASGGFIIGFYLDVPQLMGVPEMVYASLASLVMGGLTWLVPNKPPGV